MKGNTSIEELWENRGLEMQVAELWRSGDLRKHPLKPSVKSLLETEGCCTEVIKQHRVPEPLFSAEYSSNVTWKKYKEVWRNREVQKKY